MLCHSVEQHFGISLVVPRIDAGVWITKQSLDNKQFEMYVTHKSLDIGKEEDDQLLQ